MKKSTLGQLISGLFAATALSTMIAAPAQAAFNPNDTSAQMFRWRWNDVAKECTNFLGPKGYGAVQVSPPHAGNNGSAWWTMYQPVNFTQLQSQMGSEAEFQAMINTCHTAKVRVYVDAVVNHMAAGSGTATNGQAWNASSLTYPMFSASDFHSACDIDPNVDYGTPGNRSKILNCKLSGLPDLSTESTYVQTQIKNYFNKLVAMGADGIRIDAAKHMQPAHITAILSGVNRTTTSGEALWLTQEVIPDGNVVRSEYFTNGTINEFQFSYAAKAMFRGDNGASISQVRTIMGQPGSWGGSWNFVQPDKATIFVNNWDTERNSSSLVASDNIAGHINDNNGNKRYVLANIFMLGWGYNAHAQVHSGYKFTSFDQGPPSASPFDASGNPLINQSWDFIHRWPEIANMVAFRSTTSGTGIENFAQGNANQIAFSRGGKGFVAINNDGSVSWNASLQTGLTSGTYCNVINGQLNAAKDGCTGTSVTVSSTGIATISLPPNNSGTAPAVALHINQKVGPASCTSSVKFRVANANTLAGQSVYVPGSLTQLGSWTATTANLLTAETTGANAPWSRTIVLPANTAFTYKFMKKGGGVADVWERNQATASGNRMGTSPATCNTTLLLDAGSFAF